MKKEIKLLHDVDKSGCQFKKGERFIVQLLKTDVAGYIQRYDRDFTMESNFGYYALVEFENGKIMTFRIDSEIHIVGNAE
ncbi:MAG: hypothetical protein LBR65_03820 [Culturomica sp.]|jgi:hypothetical protein|nr:hypothetical protein [Culturomica sp.]